MRRLLIAAMVFLLLSGMGPGLGRLEAAKPARAFATTGPTWYSEGMAELGTYWREGDTSVNADPRILEYLASPTRRRACKRCWPRSKTPATAGRTTPGAGPSATSW